VSTITVKQLHLETKDVLDQLERGKSLVITRKDRAIARLEPLGPKSLRPWGEIMQEVWQAQDDIAAADRTANPVLGERRRRRR
jgi:antitoxin (DNA-binding transcriptional repressor) of toxin-antitoxin stability system